MTKRLMVLGAGPEAVSILKTAKEMGLFVIAVDGNESAVGFDISDEKCHCSTYDVHGAVEHGLRLRPDGVIAAAADVPLTVSHVATALGLPCIPPERAKYGADKIAQVDLLTKAGIPVPRWWQIVAVVDVITCLRGLNDIVIKPADSRGARGVRRLSDASSISDIRAAFESARQASPTGRVVAEEWLDGPQLSTEAILCSDGTAVSFTLDRNYSRLAEFAPYVIEDGADGPTRLSPMEEAEVTGVFLDAARAIVGETPCTVKGDLVLTKDGPKVIEIALRLSGGYMSTQLLPKMTGIDVIEWAIRLALGEHVTSMQVMAQERKPYNGVAIRYNIPKGCTNHTERKQHVVCQAPTRDGAIRLADNAITTVTRVDAEYGNARVI